MNKIRRINNYEITSGGYIFDLLDRTSQKVAEKKRPEYSYWLTASAKIKFLRQSDATTITLMHVHARNSFWSSRVVYTTAILMDNIANKPIAIAKFKFVGKTHLHNGGNKCQKRK